MENASKALIMGAEILIGVMILSIGVYLFNVLGSYSADTTQEMESTRLEQFNDQFTKYYGTVSTQQEDGKIYEQTIKCTMQDVVGVANLAKMYNLRNGFETPQETKENPGIYYIQIDLKTSSKTIKHLEQKEQSELVDLLKDNGNYGIIVEPDERNDIVANTKYYEVTELDYSEITGRVNYMKFVYNEGL